MYMKKSGHISNKHTNQLFIFSYHLRIHNFLCLLLLSTSYFISTSTAVSSSSHTLGDLNNYLGEKGKKNKKHSLLYSSTQASTIMLSNLRQRKFKVRGGEEKKDRSTTSSAIAQEQTNIPGDLSTNTNNNVNSQEEKVPAPESIPNNTYKPSKIRSAIFPIYGTEVKKFILMGAIKFFIIMALTLTRDTKDTLVVTQCGAEAIAFLKVCLISTIFYV